ncbi:arsenate reductase ArsC [Denitratisoma sp. agr-D3]
MADRSYNVLFLCTGNSARSILAEALLNRLGRGRFRAFSAGSQPAGKVHPLALALLAEKGFPTDALRSKSWDEFAAVGAPAMDIVITVCDGAAGESCPVFPGAPLKAHWGIEDPVAVVGDASDQRAAFARAFLLLNRRIDLFTNLPLDKQDAGEITEELAEIGRVLEEA